MFLPLCESLRCVLVCALGMPPVLLLNTICAYEGLIPPFALVDWTILIGSDFEAIWQLWVDQNTINAVLGMKSVAVDHKSSELGILLGVEWNSSCHFCFNPCEVSDLGSVVPVQKYQFCMICTDHRQMHHLCV